MVMVAVISVAAAAAVVVADVVDVACQRNFNCCLAKPSEKNSNVIALSNKIINAQAMC